jgi:8-oxo-dGTP diphosphatase
MKRRIAASAVVFGSAGRVLLVRSSKRGEWELPGGKVRKAESPNAGVVREVKEESGLRVEPIRLIGVFFIAKLLFYDVVYECRLLDEDPAPRPRPPEIFAAGLFDPADLPSPTVTFAAQRIADARSGISHSLPIELSPDQWLKMTPPSSPRPKND